jgi:hypothetical protein
MLLKASCTLCTSCVYVSHSILTTNPGGKKYCVHFIYEETGWDVWSLLQDGTVVWYSWDSKRSQADSKAHTLCMLLSGHVPSVCTIRCDKGCSYHDPEPSFQLLVSAGARCIPPLLIGCQAQTHHDFAQEKADIVWIVSEMSRNPIPTWFSLLSPKTTLAYWIQRIIYIESVQRPSRCQKLSH